MSGVRYTPLARISVPKGDVFHALKSDDIDFNGFGEAYFTTVEHRAIKGWRRHRRMVMNLFVPVGAVRFVVHDEAVSEDCPERIRVFEISETADRYGRLTVGPGLWLAFQGLGVATNLVLNIASLPHDPVESDTRPLDATAWNWTT